MLCNNGRNLWQLIIMKMVIIAADQKYAVLWRSSDQGMDAIMRYDKISSNFEDKTMEIEEIQETMDSRGWVPKFATELIYQIGHSSKSIWVTRLLFCQNDSLMGGSFWSKDSFITYIIFELCLIWYISPLANFRIHPLIFFWYKLEGESQNLRRG